jgi:hypothetical protein
MKCLFLDCAIERQDLTQHINKTHGMSTEEYKQKFKVDNVVDEEKRKQRSETRQNHFNKIACPICNERVRTAKALERHCIETRETKHSCLIFNETNTDNWVECKICGLRRSIISNHIKIHNISLEDYKNKYGEVYSKNHLKNIQENGRKVLLKEGFQIGVNNSFFGKHHTKKWGKRVSKKLKAKNALLSQHFNKGRKHTLVTRRRMSLGRMGDKNGRYGKPAARTSAFSIHGFRKDINHYVASTFEANFARYLQFNHIKYEYEPRGFEIIVNGRKATSWIDFHLVDTDEWIELKNYVGRDLSKFNAVKQTYPSINACVLYQSSDEWKQIEAKHKPLIPLWETFNQNLRNCPNLY